VALTTFLFDLDGTLIDSIDLILRSYRHTLKTHRGIEPPDDPAEIQAMVATYRDYNLANHDAMVRPYDGVADEVLRLKAQGKRLGLVTSKMRSGALRGLGVAGLAAAFDVVIGSDDVQHPKPHPEPVIMALDRLGATPAGTVFIGDSRHDLECGRAAGVQTAAVLWGPFSRDDLADLAPDYWLETPADLARLADPPTPDT